mgnify:CR=1 FL=1
MAKFLFAFPFSDNCFLATHLTLDILLGFAILYFGVLLNVYEILRPTSELDATLQDVFEFSGAGFTTIIILTAFIALFLIKDKIFQNKVAKLRFAFGLLHLVSAAGFVGYFLYRLDHKIEAPSKVSYDSDDKDLAKKYIIAVGALSGALFVLSLNRLAERFKEPFDESDILVRLN